jgi:hypothetical protein
MRWANTVPTLCVACETWGHIGDRADSQPTHEYPPHSDDMTTWGIRGTLAAVGVATVIAGFGGTAIYAATGSDAHFMGGHGNQGPPRPDGPRGQGGLGGLDPFHDADSGTSADTALHAEFVVSDHDGGYTTMVSQTGTVTAVGATSVTARSADGYTQTYVVPSAATAAPFAVDDQVIIRASRPRTGGAPIVTTMRAPMLGH